jgi:hypothetical protein
MISRLNIIIKMLFCVIYNIIVILCFLLVREIGYLLMVRLILTKLDFNHKYKQNLKKLKSENNVYVVFL